MRLYKIFFFFCISLMYLGKNYPLSTNTPIHHDMSQNIDVIGHTFRISYAPTPWKIKYLDWRLEDSLSALKKSVEKQPSVSEFQHELRRFFIGMRDFHTGILFHSTEAAKLPFQMARSGNRFFISKAYSLFSTPQFPVNLRKGDEVLAIDGVHIASAFNNFNKKQFEGSLNASEMGLCLKHFTQRMGLALHPMPKNKEIATIEVRRKNTHTIEQVLLPWMYFPEHIAFCRSPTSGNTQNKSMISSKRNMSTYFALADDIFEQQMRPFVLQNTPPKKLLKYLKKSKTKKKKDSDEMLEAQIRELQDYIKQKEGTILPPLGKVLWQSSPENYFQAAIYQLPTKERIGFIRLRTYLPERTENIFWKMSHLLGDGSLPWKEFEKLIEMFEKKTDALVIDQMDNSGGDFFYLIGLASMLTPSPLKLPKHYISLCSGDIQEAVIFLALSEGVKTKDDLDEMWEEMFSEEYESKTLCGYQADFNLLKQMRSFFVDIKTSWEDGKTYTAPLYLYGIPEVQPHPKVRYTKPLVILTDHMDFSCADILPQIFQDNNRAIIFGERTAGAGGAINQASYPNRLGIMAYSFTTTLAIRPNKKPIENLGVTPNIEYLPTPEDLEHNYRDYVTKLNQTLQALIHKN